MATFEWGKHERLRRRMCACQFGSLCLRTILGVCKAGDGSLGGVFCDTMCSFEGVCFVLFSLFRSLSWGGRRACLTSRWEKWIRWPGKEGIFFWLEGAAVVPVQRSWSFSEQPGGLFSLNSLQGAHRCSLRTLLVPRPCYLWLNFIHCIFCILCFLCEISQYEFLTVDAHGWRRNALGDFVPGEPQVDFQRTFRVWTTR